VVLDGVDAGGSPDEVDRRWQALADLAARGVGVLAGTAAAPVDLPDHCTTLTLSGPVPATMLEEATL
jgi:hypothetical protein